MKTKTYLCLTVCFAVAFGVQAQDPLHLTLPLNISLSVVTQAQDVASGAVVTRKVIKSKFMTRDVLNL